MLKKNKKLTYEQEYAVKAKQKQNELAKWVNAYPIKGPTLQVEDVPKKHKSSVDIRTVLDLGKDVQTYLRRLKVSRNRKNRLEARFRAVTFVNHHFPDLNDTSDSFLSNLQTLLLEERRRGIKQGRRAEVLKAKKRK